MIKRNVIPVLRTLLGGSIENSPLVDQFHKGDMVIYWQTGSTTWLNSLEFPERAEGQSLDLVWIDEARLVRNLELALMVIQRRLRGSPTGKASGFKPMAYMTTTPDYPGSELHAFCENPETRHPNLKVIRMPLIDNTANLPQNYIDNVIRAHSGGLAEQFIYGRFAMVEMGSFAFDYTQHVIPNMTYDPALHRKICYGVDFGWDNPSAIVVIGFDGDDRAYILDEYYKNMTSIDELVNELKEFYTIYGKGTAYCDPTEKQTVETMKQKGIIARPCLVKRDDGIRELGGRFQLQGDGRYRIYINSNCVNTISELQTYNAEKKERDHACFTEGTPILTTEGYIPIENIGIRDHVLTRRGYERVIGMGLTNIQSEIHRLTCSNGDTLYGTGNHPIWVEGLGFTQMDSLRYAFIMDSQRYNDRKWLKNSFTKARHIADTLIPRIDPQDFIIDLRDGVGHPSSFIEKYTRIIMEKYQKAITYTMSIMILLIMIQKTLNAYQKKITYPIITKDSITTRNIGKDRLNILNLSDPSPRNGTPQKRDTNGIVNTGITPLRKHSLEKRKHVKSVEKNTLIDPRSSMVDSVQINANQLGEERQVLMMRNAHALYAEIYSQLINTVRHEPVHVVAVQKLGKKEPVYNLAVDKTHEYYANDLLVSNCDGIRYVVSSVRPMGPVRGRRGRVP